MVDRCWQYHPGDMDIMDLPQNRGSYFLLSYFSTQHITKPYGLEYWYHLSLVNHILFGDASSVYLRFHRTWFSVMSLLLPWSGNACQLVHITLPKWPKMPQTDPLLIESDSSYLVVKSSFSHAPSDVFIPMVKSRWWFLPVAAITTAKLFPYEALRLQEAINHETSHIINGNFRILKWRYCTI